MMEFNKPMDVSAFDWDDSALIEAYDLAVIAEKKSKQSKANKENVKEGKKKKHWSVGDYCRAIYHEDGLYYEAMIMDIQGDSCTVEFLGYGDYEEALLATLENSLGKKARQKQRKSVKKPNLSICASDTDYSYMNESKDMNKTANSGHVPNFNTIAEQCDHYTAQHNPEANMQHSIPPQFTFNHAPHANTMPPPAPRISGPSHCLPPPPPPPPCSATANDPTLSAMLMSWYMAGYYTGLHQNKKSSHCSKSHCCEQHHVPNHCGHFF